MRLLWQCDVGFVNALLNEVKIYHDLHLYVYASVLKLCSTFKNIPQYAIIQCITDINNGTAKKDGLL